MQPGMSSNQYNPPHIERGGGGSLNPQNPPASESAPQIRNLLCSIEEMSIQLDAAVGRLEKRLDDVLTPVPPSGESTGAPTPQKPMSTILERSHSFHSYLQRLCARVEQITARVEV